MRLHMDRMGKIAVVECQGRIVRGAAAFRLRDAVTSQGDARAIVLDLSEVYARGGAGSETFHALASILARRELPFWICFQQGPRFIGGHRFGKVKSLCVFAPEFPQYRKLFGRLHPFGNHIEP